MLAGMNNIVLVHGAWADTSGWRAVHDLLCAGGYVVSAVQSPLTSLADDVAAVRRVLARQNGATLLVGHSYGGAVITEVGVAANVAGLVYVAAFVPDVGESVDALLDVETKGFFQPSSDGFVFFNAALFPQLFAQDMPTTQGVFLAAAQAPPASLALGTAVSRAAWRDRPSWYVLATEDRIISPASQRQMAARANAFITEARGGHAVHISRPRLVAEIIAAAAAQMTALNHA